MLLEFVLLLTQILKRTCEKSIEKNYLKPILDYIPKKENENK